MKKRIKYITFADFMFVLLLILAGSFAGAASDLLYFGAYAVPIFLIIFLFREEFASPYDKIKIKKGGGLAAITFGSPTILAVMGIAALTSEVIEGLGGEVEKISTVPHFVYSVLLLALAPAIVEELLFRYVPMKLIADRSPRACVLFSAVMFSASHLSLQSIPYAFFAGVVFMAVDIIADSVLPSVILHFLNNFLSVSFAYFGKEMWFEIGIIVIFSLLLALSLVLFIVKRKKLISEIRAAFSAGERFSGFAFAAVFVLCCLFIAASKFMV